MSSLHRALSGHVLATLRAVPESERGPALAAVDAFLSAPAPSTFLATVRALSECRQRSLLHRSGAATLERARQHGLESLRQVPGFPSALVDRLEALPASPRTGPRLMALAGLARSYHELAARVAADTYEMRRKLRSKFPRRGGRR